MASCPASLDSAACNSHPAGGPTTVTTTGWGALSSTLQGVTATLNPVSLPSAGTTELPSPLGHHTWPHIPATSATASPTPTTPHRGPQEVTGPQNKLPEGDQVPHSPPSYHPAHCHSPPATFLPPSWQLCRLEVISLTVAAAGQPHRHPGLAHSALAGPRGWPQIVVTYSPARLPRRRCADMHTSTRTNTSCSPQRQGCRLHPAHLWDAAATQLPGDCPQPLTGLHHPTYPHTSGYFTSLGAGT